MERLQLTPTSAILLGALVAGILDIAAVFAFWIVRDVAPTAILQSIATSVLGRAAFDLGVASVLLGLVLHFAVSGVFATAYVVASSYIRALRERPVLFGLVYGLVAYVIMTFAVVPFSLAEFGRSWPPPPINLAASVSIHLFLFGLPIALAASRIAPSRVGQNASPA